MSLQTESSMASVAFGDGESISVYDALERVCSPHVSKRSYLSMLRTNELVSEYAVDDKTLRDAFLLVLKSGLEDASRTLGYDKSGYSRMLVGGQLYMLYALSNAPSTVEGYLNLMRLRLNSTVRSFMTKHLTDVQEAITKYDHFNYAYDYLGARNITGIYLSRAEWEGSIVETPCFMYMRVAIQLHHHNPSRVFKAFRSFISRRLSPASPTLFNAGLEKPQMSSCYLMSVGDDSDSITMAMRKLGIISSLCGGNGIDLSLIRHSIMRHTGLSAGVVPLCRIVNDILRFFDQGGGKRKGAATVFLRTHHIDLIEFVQLVDKVGAADLRAHDINVGLWTSWLFWKRVRENGMWTLFCPALTPKLNNVYGRDFERIYVEYENDKALDQRFVKRMNARDVLNEIIKIQRIAGMPFIMHADTINATSAHSHIGVIRSSNLCVAGSTLLLTISGYHPIQTLEGREVSVWNGSSWSKVTVKKTGTMRPLVTVVLDNGMQLTCTPNHQFLTSYGSVKKGERGSFKAAVRTMAIDLKKADKLLNCVYPVVETSVEREWSHAYLHGVWSSVGCIVEDMQGYSYKVELGERAHILSDQPVENGVINPKLQFQMRSWRSVPLCHSLKSRVQWLSGVVDACGCETYGRILIELTGLTFARDVQLLLSTLGVASSVVELESPFSIQDNEKKQYRVIFQSGYIPHLIKLGFKTLHLKPGYCGAGVAEHVPTVAQVLNTGEAGDTYCFEEPLEHAAVFNGILTGQCLEIVEYTDERNVNVCNLQSINFESVVPKTHHEEPKTLQEAIDRCDWKLLGKLSRDAVINLNAIIDTNYYPLDEEPSTVEKPSIRSTNSRFRSIGIGGQGLADFFFKLDVAFTSDTAARLDDMLYSCIYFNAIAQSVQLSIYNGPCEVFEGSPWSEGKFQFDLRKELVRERYPGETPSELLKSVHPLYPSMWKQADIKLHDINGHIIDTIRPTWEDLKRCVVKYGMRNSMLTAQMPTASSSKHLRNNESTELPPGNIYSAKILSGSYAVLNRFMQTDLELIGLWNTHMKDFIISSDGSLSAVVEFVRSRGDLFPSFNSSDPTLISRLHFLKSKYLTMYEVSQKLILERAAIRSKVIDQSQSMSVYFKDATIEKMVALLLHGDWLCLKTGMYYLRTRSASENTNILASPKQLVSADVTSRDVDRPAEQVQDERVCSGGICSSCSS